MYAQRPSSSDCRHSTSSTSASPIIVCCAGHHIFTARRQSTRRPLAGPGGRSTGRSSRPTCSRHRCVTNDSGNTWMVMLYDKTISELLDYQIPVQLIIFRRRPTSTWFDDDCRKAKRALRASEKAARRAGPLSNIDLPAVRAWRAQRRQYFELLRLKRTAFWTTRVDAQQSQPHRLLRSFDELLGRGRVPPSTDTSASDMQFFRQ